jgi:hypothetical protein
VRISISLVTIPGVKRRKCIASWHREAQNTWMFIEYPPLTLQAKGAFSEQYGVKFHKKGRVFALSRQENKKACRDNVISCREK